MARARDSAGRFLSGGLKKDTLSGKLDKLAKRFGGNVEGALYRRAQMIMAESKARFVPVDLGPLKSSGFVDRPERSGRRVSVTLSYGGAASAYALAVHEHPSKYSPPSWKGVVVTFSPSGTGPKYLERPMMAAVGTLARDLADDLTSGWSGGM